MTIHEVAGRTSRPSPLPGLVRRAGGRSRADLLLAAGMVVSAVVGRADLWFLLVIVLLSRMLSSPRRSVLSCVPAAALLPSAGVIACLTAASLLGLRLLSSTTASRLFLVAVSVGVVLFLQGGREKGPLASGSELLASLPAGVVLLLGAWMSRRSLTDAVGGLLLGWDNGAHILYSGEIARSGELSYDARPYPRGLHALVALFATARGRLTPTPDSFEALLRTQSLTVWVLFALLTLTVALTALRLSALRSLPSPLATTAALAAGLTALSPYFFSFTMQYGFETTIAVALVLAVLSLELLQSRTQHVLVLVGAAAVTATAHTYQLLLPVAALPLIVEGVRLLQRRPTGWVAVAAASSLLLLTAVPPSWAVVRDAGVAVVAVPGAAAGLPVAWLLAGLAAATWLTCSRRREPFLMSCMVLALLASALVSAWLSGASLEDYYPRKLLWHVAMLTVPITCVAGAVLLRELTSQTAALFVRVLGGAAGGFVVFVLTVLAVPGPYMAVSGGWTVPGDVVGVLMHPEDEERLCALDSEFARQVGFRMLAFYGGPEPPLAALPPCPTPPAVRDSTGPA